MKISKIVGREIFDSRGFPTIECELILEDDSFVVASVPAGASCSSYEAVELRDGGDRLQGKGVQTAIKNLETIIAPALIGKEPDVVILDQVMIELDGTDRKSRLGANAILAASIAVCKAQALINNLYPYELIAYLCQKESVVIPFALFNILNGGAHARNSLAIQEFMILPTGAKTFRHALEQAMTIFHTLERLLIKKGKWAGVGDEGGFAPMNVGEYEALDLIMESVMTSGIESPNDVVIALDVAATQFYDPQTQLYQWQGKKVEVDVLIDFYSQIINRYPIYSIEDPCAESDYMGWKKMIVQTGDKIHVVGDDIFATNLAHLSNGINQGLVDAAIIKLNQVGTVTEALRAVDLCKENNIVTIVSHRSGETNDDFIVDLAVGTNSGFLKAGGCCRGERMAKYNRLLKIEDDLLFSSLPVS